MSLAPFNVLLRTSAPLKSPSKLTFSDPVLTSLSVPSSPNQSTVTFQSEFADENGFHTRAIGVLIGVVSSLNFTPLHSRLASETPKNVASELAAGANHVGRYSGVGLSGPSVRPSSFNWPCDPDE